MITIPASDEVLEKFLNLIDVTAESDGKFSKLSLPTRPAVQEVSVDEREDDDMPSQKEDVPSQKEEATRGVSSSDPKPNGRDDLQIVAGIEAAALRQTLPDLMSCQPPSLDSKTTKTSS